MNKTKFELRLENFIYNKLNDYVVTESIRDLIKKLDLFALNHSSELTQNSLNDVNKNDFNENASIVSNDEQNQTEEYLEILKLRHINLARSVVKNVGNNPKKRIFLIYGPRAGGKTSFMLQVYRNVNSLPSGTFSMSDLPDSLKNRSIASSSTRSIHNNKPKPLFLFYFLKPKDSFLSVLIDITYKMRLKYAKLGLFLLYK